MKWLQLIEEVVKEFSEQRNLLDRVLANQIQEKLSIRQLVRDVGNLDNKIEDLRNITMASFQDLANDLAQFKTDLATKLAQIQKELDAFRASIGNLTPEQQAFLDNADSAVKEADNSITAFDPPAVVAQVKKG